MAEAKAAQKWDHTAFLLCTMHNMVGKKRYKVEQFHPYLKKRGSAGSSGGMSWEEFKGQMKPLLIRNKEKKDA